MLSLTPITPEPDSAQVPADQPCEDIGYYLRRAEEESVAAIKAVDARASRSHSDLANLYSERSVKLIRE